MKRNQLALYWAKLAIFSEINTKHTNTVWQNVKFLNIGASHNQQALTGSYLMEKSNNYSDLSYTFAINQCPHFGSLVTGVYL